MVICSNCNGENRNEAKFCAKCGKPLNANLTSPAISSSFQPKALIPVENLFKNTWELYKKSWLNLLLISLITVAAWTVWKIMIIPAILAIFGLGALATGDLSLGFSVGLVGIAVLILTWVIIFEIGFWGSAAMVIALEDAVKGQTAKLWDIYSQAKNLLWSLSFASLLVMVAILAGLVFLIIPGLVIVFLLSFVNFVVIAEKKTGTEALSRSAHLIWNNFWGILGRNILILLAVCLINIIFGRMLLFGIVSQVIVLPFVLTYHYLIYKSASS